jgi:hypothetical protein
MLTLYRSRAWRRERPAILAEGSLPKNVAWIDLLKREPDEVAFVKRTAGLDVPSIEDLSEIESSSRLSSQNGCRDIVLEAWDKSLDPLFDRQARCCRALRVSADCDARPGPHTRGKPRLLDVGRRNPARDRFAPDSPLERHGFTLSVPPGNLDRSEPVQPRVETNMARLSNPVPLQQ